MVNVLTTRSFFRNFTCFSGPKDGENVCSLILCRTILQLNSSIFYKLSDEVVVCINMFGTLVEDWILGKFHHPLIVTE